MNWIVQWTLIIVLFGSAESGLSQAIDLAAKTTEAKTNDSAASSSSLCLRELTQLLVPASNVNAAYSLDPRVAEAQAQDGQVRIWGRSPGQASIVLVHPDFTTSILHVTVTQAPPILPDQVWSGLNNLDSRGYYEARVSSDPMQIDNTFEYRTSRMQLHLTNANLPSQTLPGVSATRFLFSYLRFFDERKQLTLLDENVESSPLSVTSTILRGLHFDSAGLSLHAGYTSITGFDSLFLPTNRQLIFGSTLGRQLDATSQAGVTAYFIQRDPTMPWQVGQGLATLFLKKKLPRGTEFSTEVGISKGIGGAVRFVHIRNGEQFHLDVRYRPRYYAASDTDNLRGLQGDTRWSRVWNSRFGSDLSGSVNHLFTGPGSQTMEVGTGNLRYKIDHGFSLSPGVSVSRFSDHQNFFPDIHRVALPVSLSYDRSRFGMSAQYEYSQTSHAFSSGRGYRGSFRWSEKHFQFNGNAGFDTQALGVDSVFSAFPQLNIELAALGLGVTSSIEQLSALLQNRAFLSNLGVAPNATLQLVPRTSYGGLNLRWQSDRQVVELESNYNLNSFLTQRTSTLLQTIRYRRGLSPSTELSTSFTMLDSASPFHSWNPIWEVSLRHQFRNNPFTQWRQQDEGISGQVSLRDSSGTKPLPGVELRLDGTRRTMSDREGRYRFTNVGRGAHTVEIRFTASRPFWYTTPSRASALAGSTVDFGIVYPVAELVGYVLTDAELRLPNIGVLVDGPQGKLNLITDQTGKFTVPVAQPGEYVARVDVASLPDGYALDNLQPAAISVAEGEVKRLSFTLPAIRAMCGVVEIYDRIKERYAPLPGVLVQLAELQLQTTTDRNGRYSFRNLPAGEFSLTVNGQQITQVHVGRSPQLIRQDVRLAGPVRAAKR